MAEPAQPVPPKDQVPQTSPDTERKLWLDYLAKLNDRELQKERSSGATTWVLLAVTAAVFYQSLQQFPRVLAARVSWVSIGSILALQADLLLISVIAVAFLFSYCKGPQERRLFPELKTRANRILRILIVSGHLLLTVLHSALSMETSLPSLVLWTVRFFALFWLANLIAGLRKYTKRFRDARKHKIILPDTTVEMPSTGLYTTIGLIAVAPLCILAGVALFLNIRGLMVLWPDAWILSLNAATQILAVVSLGGFLFVRALYSLSRSVYLGLERDIILERLPLEEVKRRFVVEALGPRIADWLRSMRVELEESQQRFEGLLRAVEKDCAETERIDPSYKLERKGRREKLTKILDDGVGDFLAKQDGLLARVQEWSRLSGHDRFELEAVKEYMEAFRGGELKEQYGKVGERILKLKGNGN